MYKEFRNTFIFGQPGTGKSKLLRNYIEEVIYDKTEDSEIFLISHKYLGYRSNKIRDEIVDDFDTNIEKIHNLYLERLEKSDLRSTPKLYVFLDGLTKTFSRINDNTKAMLGEMMENGPKAKLYCVMTSSSRDFDEHILSGSTIIELK